MDSESGETDSDYERERVLSISVLVWRTQQRAGCDESLTMITEF